MTNRKQITRRRERGSNLVESSFVLTAFLFIIFGTVEFGRMTFAFNFVSEGATEGARWASVRGASSTSPADNTAITTHVKQWAAGLNASNVTVATTWNPDNNPGSTVTVRCTYAWTSIIGILVPSSIDFSHTSTMLVLE